MAKLGSLEYKKLLSRFGKNANEIVDDTYQATKPTTPPKKRAAAIKTARKKLADYDELLAQLEGNQRATAEKDYGHLMVMIRDDLAKLEKEGVT
jgi:hypothetical protein